MALSTRVRRAPAASAPGTKKQPGSERLAAEAGSALLVSPKEHDHLALETIFVRSNWALYRAATLSDALEFVRGNRISIIICESDLQPGTWKDMLQQILCLPEPPFLIVTSRLADDYLWAEALNLGAYDVLVQPFDAQEVTRVMASAWRHWWQPRAAPAAGA